MIIKNKDTRRKVYRVLSVLYRMLSVGVLLGVAILFPRYYCDFYDQNTLNDMVATDIRIKTYETAYTSFAEKIHAIARIYTSGANHLCALETSEAVGELKRKELTGIAREELNKMYKSHIIPIRLKPTEKRMTSCEQYMIYGLNEEDGMKGINCWRMVYSNKKRIITLYLDEEYHKIFFLKITQRGAAGSARTNKSVVDAKTGLYDASIEGEIATPDKDWYLWYEAILNYYDLFTYPSFSVDDFSYDQAGQSSMEIYFENTGKFSILRYYTPEEAGISLNVGLPLEKLIQF